MDVNISCACQDKAKLYALIYQPYGNSCAFSLSLCQCGILEQVISFTGISPLTLMELLI